MLKEFKKVRQPDTQSRKLFSDNYFDLYLWYKKNDNQFLGFQLVFSVNETQMALTAELGKFPQINIIDSGDGELYGPTDLLNGVGYFPKVDLYNEFYKRSKSIDRDIRDKVLEVINTYHPKNDVLEEKYCNLTALY